MLSFCSAELRKRNLIYQKISTPVFAARGIERKFQPCFFRSLSDISFVIYSMQKINHDKKSLQIALKAQKISYEQAQGMPLHRGFRKPSEIKKFKKISKKNTKKERSFRFSLMKTIS